MLMGSLFCIHSVLLLLVATQAIMRPFTPATVHSCTVLDSTVSDWCPTWWTGMWDMFLLLLWGCVWCGRLVLSTAGFHFSITKPFLNLVISGFLSPYYWNLLFIMSWSFICLAILYHAIRVIGSGLLYLYHYAMTFLIRNLSTLYVCGPIRLFRPCWL